MLKITVFLDVDGVLNTSESCQSTPQGYIGIDEPRVEILAKALRKYDCFNIILTSDWKKMKEYEEDYVYLVEKLALYGLSISDKTVDEDRNRAEGIMNYLKEHPDIEKFVILDDFDYDFIKYKKLWDRFLITDGIERSKLASTTPELETIIFLGFIKEFS